VLCACYDETGMFVDLQSLDAALANFKNDLANS